MRKRFLFVFGGLAGAVLMLLALPGCDPKKFAKDPFAFLGFLLVLVTGLTLTQIAPFKTDLSPTMKLAYRTKALSLPAAVEGAPMTMPKGQVLDGYVSFESSGDESFGVLGLYRELRHPFRFEVTLGLFDLAAVDSLDDGFVAAEIDMIDPEPSNPLKFITCGVQPIVSQGVVTHANVFVATENGNQGQLVLPDTWLVDLAFMSNGTNVDVCARPHGNLSWQFVATVPRPAPDSTWHPFVGAVGLDAGGALGAYDFKLLANGPSTARPGSVEDALDRAWNGYSALLQARELLQGEPETDAARDQLEIAVAELTAARDIAQALLDEGFAGAPMTPARKQLAKSTKDATDALGLLDKGKKPKKIIEEICKAELAVLKALGALRAEMLSVVS